MKFPHFIAIFTIAGLGTVSLLISPYLFISACSVALVAAVYFIMKERSEGVSNG